MFVIVTKQIGVEAETIEAGIAAVANGEGATISISAQARPQPGQPPIGQVQGSGQVITGAFQNTQTQATPQLKKS